MKSLKIAFLLFSIMLMGIFSCSACFVSGKNSACSARDKNLKFENTIRIGSFTYLLGIVDVIPFYGIDYNLPRTNKTGFQISYARGIVINNKFHFGAEVGYGNYQGINGLMTLSDIRIDSKRKRMFFYFDPGYSHFWSPYAINNTGNGTSSFLLDFGFGANVYHTKKSRSMLSTGILYMQQNFYIPIKYGFTF